MRAFERGALRCALVVLVFLAVAPRDVAAQDTGLSKSELVRVVVSPDSLAQKLETVRSRCLSFEPTEGDWRDLRNLGASEELIAAAQQCARNARTVSVALNASRVTVAAGDTTMVTVDLFARGFRARRSGPSSSPDPAAPEPGPAIRAPRTPAEGPSSASRPASGSERRDTPCPFRESSCRVRPGSRSRRWPTHRPWRRSIRRSWNCRPVRTCRRSWCPCGTGLAIRSTESNWTWSGAPAKALRFSLPRRPARTARRPCRSPESPRPEEIAWEVRGGETVLASLPVTIGSPPDALAAAAAAAAGAAVAGADEAPPGMPGTEAVDDAAVREGLAFLEEGDPVEAEASFRRALGVSPDGRTRRRDSRNRCSPRTGRMRRSPGSSSPPARIPETPTPGTVSGARTRRIGAGRTRPAPSLERRKSIRVARSWRPRSRTWAVRQVTWRVFYGVEAPRATLSREV